MKDTEPTASAGCVRHVGITKAATALQQRKPTHHRPAGHSRFSTLEAAACGCYAADKVTYARMMG